MMMMKGRRRLWRTMLVIKIASKSLVQQRDKPQFHNTTTMPSRKRMNASTKRVQVVPLHVRLLSDLSFEKCLDDKQIHKGFKKMESDHHTKKKREEGAQKTPPYPMQEKRVHHWFNKDECGHQACTSCEIDAKRNTNHQ